MGVYVIEFIGPNGRLSCTRIVADTARMALDEFERNHPGCDVTELRRDHHVQA